MDAPRSRRCRVAERSPLRAPRTAHAGRGGRRRRRRSRAARHRRGVIASSPTRGDREMPAGRVDDGESAVDAAARETLEESGWQPGPLTPMTRYFPNNGTTDAAFNVFLSTSATHVGEPTDPDEAERVEWLSWNTVRSEIEAGRVSRRPLAHRAAVPTRLHQPLKSTGFPIGDEPCQREPNLCERSSPSARRCSRESPVWGLCERTSPPTILSLTQTWGATPSP